MFLLWEGMDYNQTDVTYLFSEEEHFDYSHKREWIDNNWTVSWYLVAAYTIVILAGKQYMKNRQRFDLRILLMIWNFSLAVFSILGMVRTLPEMAADFKDYGFHFTVCTPDFARMRKITGFWTWLFLLSKFVELGDTVFIILRKQPLIFLHYYHHITVLLYCWYTNFYNSAGRWHLVLNYTVHSFMYSYYFFKAARIRIPVQISKFITIVQIAQMFIGIYILSWCIQVRSKGDFCGVSNEVLTLGSLMYFSYLVLFVRFFYNAHFGKPKPLPLEKKQS